MSTTMTTRAAAGLLALAMPALSQVQVMGPKIHPTGQGAGDGGVPAFGLAHTALGAAQLSTGPAGSLVVSNLGSSGDDGVSIALGPGLAGMAVDFPPGFGLVLGADDGKVLEGRVQVTSAGQELTGVIVRLEAVGGGVQLGVDFDGLGATSTDVAFWADDVLVSSQTFPATNDAPTGFFICPDGTPAQLVCVTRVEIRCEDGESDEVEVTTCSYQCVETPIGPVTTNAITFARDTGVLIESIESLDIYGTSLGSMEIVGEAVQFGAGMLATLGDATFQKVPQGLAIANIGSSGCDGVRIQLPSSSYAEYAFEDPLANAPDGAFVVTQVSGTVDGQTGTLLGTQSSTVRNGQVETSFDVSPLGAASFTLEVYDGGALVASLPGQPNGSGFTMPQAAGEIPTTKYKKSTDPDIAYVCCLPEIIITAGAFIGLGDEVVIKPDTGASVTALEEVVVRAANVGTLTLLGTLANELPWITLPGGLAGSRGTPSLGGTGPLTGGSTAGFDIEGGVPGAPATLVVGFAEISAPFKGGTLVPSPDVLLTLVTDAGGAASLSATWPFGLPSGLAFSMQAWLVDAAGPNGLSATNGLRATLP